MGTLGQSPQLIDLIFPEQLSARIGISVQTLARWRSEGRGPSYYKIGGKRVAYHTSVVEAWLESNKRKIVPTDQDGWT